MINRLSTLLPNYEVRPEQEKMAKDIEKAFATHSIALIEAGTGTGKTMAYLLPAIDSDKRTVISTHTINLQEQLLQKDIPLALKACQVEQSVILVKGMHNYLCLRRAEEDPEMEAWGNSTRDGSRSTLPFATNRERWERVRAEGDACTHAKCPHYNQCFFFKARKEVEDAKLLIVNHHLLLADLKLKADGETGILPNYDQLIIDEAHHLEAVATKIWAITLSRAELHSLLSRTEEKLHDLNLLAQKRELALQVNETYHQFSQETTQRLSNFEGPEWESALSLADEITRYATALRSIEEIDLQALSGKLETFATHLRSFVKDPISPEVVRWIEITPTNVRLVRAPLDTSHLLQERLFQNTPSVILTSATLATGGNFSYLKQRLGIEEEAIESIYASPFDYTSQGLFLIPNDLPTPTHPNFSKKASEAIFQAIQAARGGTFVLFTSYQMMRTCQELLAASLKENRFPLYVQGEGTRTKLLQSFKNDERAVLFGTSSFWEGVDVAGQALRCVILAKLPFKVPSEPLTQARYEALSAAGKSPFTAAAIPEAIITLKQGVGRLIRNTTDRGCIVCLDSRLIHKPYGKLFLKSLPPFACQEIPAADLGSQISRFFQNKTVA